MGAPHLLLNVTESTWASAEAPTGRALAYSAKNPGKSPQNEDCCLVFPTSSGVILAVADGVGGGVEGDKASRLAVQALTECLSLDPSRAGILDAFEMANRRIMELGSGAATTLSVVEVLEDELRPYHAGDSTALVLGGRGKVKLLTIAHSPVGYGVEAGLIEPDDALHHDDLNLVSNILGSSDMRIEMGSTLKLSPRDTVVLGTDGLFDNLQLSEVVRLSRKGPLDKASAALAQLAKERMNADGDSQLATGEPIPSKPDDVTFIMYRPRATPRAQKGSQGSSQSSSSK